MAMILAAAGIQLMTLCPEGDSSSSLMTVKLDQDGVSMRLVNYTSIGNILNITDEKSVGFENVSHLYEYFDAGQLDDIIGGLTSQPGQTMLVIRVHEDCHNFTLIDPVTNWYMQKSK